MSKAEERALEIYPKKGNDGLGEHLVRGMFVSGYQTAEKDLELTFEDVDWLLEQVRTMSGLWVKTNPSCEKVLQKFNEMKRNVL